MSLLLGETELRELLMANSEEYRRLAAEHQSYENQLEQLTHRNHLTDDERLKEITLKKKKLMLKDQMYSIIQKYRKGLDTGQ